MRIILQLKKKKTQLHMAGQAADDCGLTELYCLLLGKGQIIVMMSDIFLRNDD